MKVRPLWWSSLFYYWRTNLAVVVGVATAVAALSGALVVGDSVRGSLRDLVLQRLGRADTVVASSSFFREALAADLGAGVVPLIVMQGAVTDQTSGRRAGRVQVYGVDDRFWRFHGIGDVAGPAGREALLSRALADAIGAPPGGTVLVRVERPSAVPIESLHGRKDDAGRTLRLTTRGVLDRSHLGEFSIRPQQGPVRAVFVPLSRLQQDIGEAQRVNALLAADASGATAAALASGLRMRTRPADYGLTIRAVDALGELAVESDAGLIDAPRASAIDRGAASSGLAATPVFTYLANAIRHGDRDVPYSIVAAVDVDLARAGARPAAAPAPSPAGASPTAPPPIVLNDWTARALAAGIGDQIVLDYYLWQEPGYLETRSAAFVVRAVVPIAGFAADRDLVPVYPGITGASSLSDWNPPFPIDLARVRPADEAYWTRYRTTPKAFIPLEAGRRLWRTRFGDRTSTRIRPAGQSVPAARERFESALLAGLDPASGGFAIRAIRAEGLAASRGATDFSEYFVYFSFFLVASAVVLATLFFRLGVEQRAREIGLLRAVGYTHARIRRGFVTEGVLLAGAGAALGTGGAIAYAAAMIAGLRTWWSGAVGTTDVTVHASGASLAIGAISAIAVAIGCIWWTLRGFGRFSERALLAGAPLARLSPIGQPRAGLRRAVFALVAIAAGLVAASITTVLPSSAAFFGAGSAVLIACLCALAFWLRGPRSAGRLRVMGLGVRNTSERPGRTVLAVAVIASAVFILIAVDAFRLEVVDATDRRSGTGGYPLLVDLLVPVVQDPNSQAGRDTLGLPASPDLQIEPFRVLAGEDASCLNLYQPVRPRILGASRRFIRQGRFSFAASVAVRDAERGNPWLLLDEPLRDGAIPVAGDANSLGYVLHKSVGDDILLQHGSSPVHLRVVAALADSIFQGELLMSETNFTALFPEQQGYRFLLIDAPAARAAQVAQTIERGAGDLGAEAILASDRLAEFHAVENTYLSTFQTLGGLGLLVGTIGLAAVLLRNVLERQRELALLRAVGYGGREVFEVVFAENLMLLVWGLAAGSISAAIAIIPAAAERGARVPVTSAGALLVLSVFAAGLLSSALATRVALRAPLVAALRSE